MKLGEIKYKNNKYYFIPNRKDDMNEITGDELFAWLVYKGNKYPETKNKYKLKEGDILKLGRIWLIVRVIHIPKKNIENKNTNCLISFHSQINESLNVNSDFKEDKDYNNLIDDDESSSLTEEGENIEVDDNDLKDKNKNEILNNSSQNKEEEKKYTNIKSKKKKKKDNYYNPKLIKKNLENNNINLKKSEKQKICRICYMTETNSLLNPLIKPCKCSGSMKYIHLKCLLYWLKTKIEVDKSEYVNNKYFTLYSSEKVECELCKQIFPHYVKHNNKLYNLLDLERNFEIEKNRKNKINNLNYTDGDNNQKNKEKKDFENINNDDSKSYIVFDTISFDKSIPSYIYLANFNNDKKLRIGRGLEMNLIMNDLSISRNHCLLEITDEEDILLQDMNSKFGTLALVQAKEIEILKGQTLALQIGRSFLNIGYKQKNKSSLFDCCNAEVIDKRKTYEDINYKAVKIYKNSVVLTESESEENDKDEEENKKSENDYENAIKNSNNNKKISILRISKTKKSLDQEETNIKAIQEIKSGDGNNIEQKDKINNNENIFISEEQGKENEKDEVNKKVENLENEKNN